MTIQQKLANRMYELLPDKKHEEHLLPLRLADVLLAIGQIDIDPFTYQESLKDIIIGFSVGKSIHNYNLSKDNILDQSDEFCEFVYELIK